MVLPLRPCGSSPPWWTVGQQGWWARTRLDRRPGGVRLLGMPSPKSSKTSVDRSCLWFLRPLSSRRVCLRAERPDALLVLCVLSGAARRALVGADGNARCRDGRPRCRLRRRAEGVGEFHPLRSPLTSRLGRSSAECTAVHLSDRPHFPRPKSAFPRSAADTDVDLASQELAIRTRRTCQKALIIVTASATHPAADVQMATDKTSMSALGPALRPPDQTPCPTRTST